LRFITFRFTFSASCHVISSSFRLSSFILLFLLTVSLPSYRCSGFANRKTLYIKAAALDCLSLHDGDIPNTIEGLLALKGVGPKVSYSLLPLLLMVAFGLAAVSRG
jgi:hypothetical protein